MTALIVAMLLAAQTASPLQAAEPTVRLAVDSSHRVVHIEAGPFAVAGAPQMDAMAHQHGGHHVGGEPTPFLPFRWPTDGWLRGVSLRITDAQGRALPRALIHHVNVINLDRRQLLYPAAERTIALGQETEDIHLPATVGIPIHSGTSMGLVVMWHNPDSVALEGVTVTLDVEWLPTNTAPRPLDVLTVYMDVRYPIGQPVEFDLPAGAQEFNAEFTMPIDGRIIAAGGHLHDYGTGLTLSEVGSGAPRNVISLATKRSPEGKVLAVDRKYPGIRGNGIRLDRGKRYRLTGSYDNSTGSTIASGAMVHLLLLFAPKHPTDWPAVDPTEPEFRKDVAEITRSADSERRAANGEQ